MKKKSHHSTEMKSYIARFTEEKENHSHCHSNTVQLKSHAIKLYTKWFTVFWLWVFVFLLLLLLAGGDYGGPLFSTLHIFIKFEIFIIIQYYFYHLKRQ